MQLESTFSVVAPIDQVWETLMDVERVAGCVPGAEVLNKLSDDAYQVGIKVKLGPVTMQYRGQISVVERDAEAHRAVFQGRAQEARGQGTAQGTATLVLVESDGATRGTVSANVELSGKVAAMGKSVIGSVTDQMMTLFAENLQAMVSAPHQDAPAPEKSPEKTPEEPTTTEGARATERPAAPKGTGPVPRPSTRPAPVHTPPATADTSLNAITLVKGMVMDQLKSPAKILGLLGAVAFIAYRLGRRAASHSAPR